MLGRDVSKTFDVLKYTGSPDFAAAWYKMQEKRILELLDDYLLNLQRFDDTKLPWKWGEKTKVCRFCNNKFEVSDRRVNYCSKKCHSLSRRKIDRPSKAILSEQIERLGYVGVAKIYGVSDNAVRKWMKN